MFNKMAIRKVVYPIASAGLFTASVAAAEEKKDEEKKQLIRRKDLSIYPAKKEEKIVTREEEDKPDSALMSAVRQVREAVWSAGKQVQGVSDSVNHVIETGKAHTASSIQILREDDHYLHRYGAITVGGLVGYVFAIRRGFFRKIIYTGTGATAVASVVYPEEAKEYSSEALAAAKKYIVVAYHFVNGDKKQGNDSDKETKKPSKPEKGLEPQPASYVVPDPNEPLAEPDYYNMYSRRA
ncbi:MICOS complex subunit MIC27 isoform X3 [Macrosteles quadrilineatus]|uniref:MICOS complex subunit MIC27 isoform X3 n=1 Tax=Macrosteles quadrilineatus TaxID=74068 RepID=UPI0023E2E9C1|nr:MICOS complex subunit MIC27 isoform X3 [Macrosteles quadrilineatus]